MKTLPLTVLVHEGPIARAYLVTLRQSGFRPERIVLMIYCDDLVSRKPIGRWLPHTWRLAYAERLHNQRLNYWPRRLRKEHPHLFEKMTTTIAKAFDLSAETFDEILTFSNYGVYAETVERVMVKGLADPTLAEFLSRFAPTAVLYTGGGIIPASLLSVPGLRFLHIHPGRLPYVRGADGLLWSTLVRGKPGASCFYMAPGIDTGGIVQAAEFSPLEFPLPANGRPDDPALYRAIFSYYDPMLRAAMLLRVFRIGDNPMNLPNQPQYLDQGITYHFMNPVLRRAALRALFPERS